LTVKLDKPLTRELVISGHPYVVTLSPEGIKLVLKGKRKGYELDWQSLVNGDAALAAALNATLRLRHRKPHPQRKRRSRVVSDDATPMATCTDAQQQASPRTTQDSGKLLHVTKLHEPIESILEK